MSFFKILEIIQVMFGVKKGNVSVDVRVQHVNGNHFVGFEQKTFCNNKMCHFLGIWIKYHSVQGAKFFAMRRKDICSFN